MECDSKGCKVQMVSWLRLKEYLKNTSLDLILDFPFFVECSSVLSLILFNTWYFHNVEAVIQRCSVKKVFWEISQNSQENTCVSLFFNIVAALRSATLLKKRLSGADAGLVLLCKWRGRISSYEMSSRLKNV